MNSIKSTTELERHKAAKVAGFTFLFFTIVSIFHYTAIEVNLIVTGSTSEVANFIRAKELLFRIGIATDLIIFISSIILALALYTILKSINSHLALLALFSILVEATLAIMIELSSFMALLLLNGQDYLNVFESKQLEALAALFLSLRLPGYTVVGLLFSLGSIIFFYLLTKSKYVPQQLAVWGLVTFSLMLLLNFTKIIVPNYAEVIRSAQIIELVISISVFLFQIAIGLWLVFKGINLQQQHDAPVGT